MTKKVKAFDTVKNLIELVAKDFKVVLENNITASVYDTEKRELAYSLFEVRTDFKAANDRERVVLMVYTHPKNHSVKPFNIILEQDLKAGVLDQYGFFLKVEVCANSRSADKDIIRHFDNKSIDQFSKLCELNEVPYTIDARSEYMTSTHYVPCINDHQFNTVVESIMDFVLEHLKNMNALAVIDKENMQARDERIDNEFLQRALNFGQPLEEIKVELNVPYVIGLLHSAGQLGKGKLQEIVDIIKE